MYPTIHALISVLVLGTVALAADGPSVERGSKLFNSTSLGTNGKSCATCHPDGKGMEEVSDNDQKTTVGVVNKCIVKALKGKALADNSLEMSSLVMYMNSLGKAKDK